MHARLRTAATKSSRTDSGRGINNCRPDMLNRGTAKTRKQAGVQLTAWAFAHIKGLTSTYIYEARFSQSSQASVITGRRHA